MKILVRYVREHFHEHTREMQLDWTNIRLGSVGRVEEAFSVSLLITVKIEGYIYCRHTRGLSWLKSYSGTLLNGMDAGIDSMLIKADNLTKLKKPASMLEDSLRNQNDLDKLKLQTKKIWCYLTGTRAQYSSESEKNCTYWRWSYWLWSSSPVKNGMLQDAVH